MYLHQKKPAPVKQKTTADSFLKVTKGSICRPDPLLREVLKVKGIKNLLACLKSETIQGHGLHSLVLVLVVGLDDPEGIYLPTETVL